MASSPTRHDTKHQIITVQTILRSKQLSSSQRDELNRNVQELKKQLETSEHKVDTEEMAFRIRFLKENRGMYDIFHTIWLLFTVYTQDGYLLKDGYVRLHHSLQIILAGLPSYSPIDQSSIEVEWTHDKLKYSEINKDAFFDLLFEVIETWCELVDPSYYAAFSWCLLDSLADTAMQPPKLRPYREMKCITKVANEASMLKNYMMNKKIRSALAIQNDVLQRIPEVQKRLSQRKLGVEFDDHITSMVELLSSQYTGTSTFEEEGGSEDGSTQGSLKNRDNLLEAEDSDEDSDDKHVVDEDSIDSEAMDAMMSPEESGLRRSKPRYLLPTSSFMAHINSRRESKIVLNGIHAFAMPSVGLHIHAEEHLSTMSSLEPSTNRTSTRTGTEATATTATAATKASHRVPIDDSVVFKDHTDLLSIPSSIDQHENIATLRAFKDSRRHEKARFSEFVTSGRSLASFAREFLLTHEGSSELPIDKFINPKTVKHLRKDNVMRMIATEQNHATAKTRARPAFKGGGGGKPSTPQLTTDGSLARMSMPTSSKMMTMMDSSLIEGKKMRTPTAAAVAVHQQPKRAPLLLLPDSNEYEKEKAPSIQPIAPIQAAAAAAAMIMFEPDASKDYSVFDLQPARVSSSQWRLLKGSSNNSNKSNKKSNSSNNNNNNNNKSKTTTDDDTITTSSVQSRSTNERRRTIYPVNGAVPVRSAPPTRRINSPPTRRINSPSSSSPSSWDITIVSPEMKKTNVSSPLMRPDASPSRRKDVQPTHHSNSNSNNIINSSATIAGTSSPKRPRPYSPYTDEIPVLIHGENAMLSDSGIPLRYQQRATIVTEGSGLKMGSTSLYSVSKLDPHHHHPTTATAAATDAAESSTTMLRTTAPIATIRKIDFLTAIKRINPSFVTADNKFKTSTSAGAAAAATAAAAAINDDLSSISSMDHFRASEDSHEQAPPPLHTTSLSALDMKTMIKKKEKHTAGSSSGGIIRSANSPSRIKKGSTAALIEYHNKYHNKTTTTKTFGAIVVKTDDASIDTDSKMNTAHATAHATAKMASEHEQYRVLSHIANSAINHDLRFDEAVKKHNTKKIERMLREEEKLSGLRSTLITAPLGPSNNNIINNNSSSSNNNNIKAKKSHETILAIAKGVPMLQSIEYDNRNSSNSSSSSNSNNSLVSIKDKSSDSCNPIIPSDEEQSLDHDSASDKGFLKHLEGGVKQFRDSFESQLSRDEDNINTHRSEKRNDDGRGGEGMGMPTNTRKDSSDSIAIPDVALQYLEALQGGDGDDMSSVTLSSLRHPSRQNLVIKSISMPSLYSPPRSSDSNNNNYNTNNNNHNDNNDNNNNHSPQRALSPDGSLRKSSLGIDPINATTTTTTLVMPMVHHTNKSKNKKILHMRSYVDEEGKLQGQDFLVEKNLFETLRDTDLVLDPPPDFNAMRLQQKDATRLATIKHPYLSLPGVKPVKYPRELSSSSTTTSVRQPYSIDMLHSQFARMVNAPQLNLKTIAADSSIDNIHRKQASQQLKTITENTDDIAVAEPVFLGNSSSAYIVSTNAYSSYARRSKSAPWLPNGSLEPMETNRSNKRLGTQEKFDLLRYSPHDPSKQIMMIKGQEAARNAFESFVSTQMI